MIDDARWSIPTERLSLGFWPPTKLVLCSKIFTFGFGDSDFLPVCYFIRAFFRAMLSSRNDNQFYSCFNIWSLSDAQNSGSVSMWHTMPKVHIQRHASFHYTSTLYKMGRKQTNEHQKFFHFCSLSSCFFHKTKLFVVWRYEQPPPNEKRTKKVEYSNV